jgi:hypothetical protein
MYYNLTRIDILLWENLSRFNFDLDMLKNTVSLDDCRVLFGGMSVFHYFSGSTDEI